MRIRPSLLLGTVLTAGLGCAGLLAPPPPSSGHCTGTLAGKPLDHPIAPSGTWFSRDDQHNLVEHAFVALLIHEPDGLVLLDVKAHFADMPEERYEGVHPLGGSGYVDRWTLQKPGGAVLERGTLTISDADRETFDAVLVMKLVDGSDVRCEIAWSRDYNRDTDD